MNIIIDFDDTVVISGYPSIGIQVPDALETIHELQEKHSIILNSARADMNNGTLEHAIKYLKSMGVNLSGSFSKKQIPKDWIKNKYIPIEYYSLHPEIFIDDIANGIPLIKIGKNDCVDWKTVKIHLIEAKIL